MRLLRPTHTFRQDIGYASAGYVATDELILLVTDGQPWEVQVQQRLIVPLAIFNRLVTKLNESEKTSVMLSLSKHLYRSTFK